ncbi:hypothetical protein J6590_017222 [Homalodisca vitripennis]|nr:hypothetical protein J6590_017222 [Homalodisca vitripennis]
MYCLKFVFVGVSDVYHKSAALTAASPRPSGYYSHHTQCTELAWSHASDYRGCGWLLAVIGRFLRSFPQFLASVTFRRSLLPAVRRRLRRPTTVASAVTKVRGDQEASASVNRFKVRTRERVVPGLLSRKSSSTAVSSGSSSSKDDSGYKVGLDATEKIVFCQISFIVSVEDNLVLFEEI